MLHRYCGQIAVRIVDIGPGDMTTPSAAYDMEHGTIFQSNYPNYVIHDIGDNSGAALEALG